MTISKQLVEVLGSRVESAPGYGSKFSFTTTVLIEEQTERQLLTLNFWKSLKELRIMLVDDSKLNRKII